ncbi:uncharacterized protein LAESUDRAFT_717027 [Laetiporus sulphureus 93-53]|uniref:Secreted protein n=1 Tax=Laetiporus sulphureus 93-53 TaxID=1314785 RepID=A0A165C310_9APHY|nr:uncharacterized protein LAESUDRAFT_717027 [Laetiporus sulphureus 93-53]KZT02110.1 hypothetical protein LAESUDRAFT_717027 [Laetiporus sulphureus 93-53]
MLLVRPVMMQLLLLLPLLEILHASMDLLPPLVSLLSCFSSHLCEVAGSSKMVTLRLIPTSCRKYQLRTSRPTETITKFFSVSSSFSLGSVMRNSECVESLREHGHSYWWRASGLGERAAAIQCIVGGGDCPKAAMPLPGRIFPGESG